MIFKNASGTCPCCQKRRSAHTRAQQARCSAWSKANLTPAKPARAEQFTKTRADGFTRLIHNLEK